MQQITDKINSIQKGISSAINSAADWFDRAVSFPLFTDPLIIDMAGDGLALDSWQTSTAAFDLDGDGTPEDTGWTKANGDDAFLVVDKNNNGNIDDISEMFGNQSTAGFAELKLYDSNNDNLMKILQINASNDNYTAQLMMVA